MPDSKTFSERSTSIASVKRNKREASRESSKSLFLAFCWQLCFNKRGTLEMDSRKRA